MMPVSLLQPHTAPDMESNIAFAMLKTEFASVGQKLSFASTNGTHNAEVCEIPFL